jgi:hypothetical protein
MQLHIPTTVFAATVFACTHSLAQQASSAYTIDRTPPTVISTGVNHTSIKFGPAELQFPSGWSFSVEGALAKGIGPSSSVVYVSVFRRSGELDVMPLSAIAVQREKVRISELVLSACTSKVPPTVRELAVNAFNHVLVGTCEEPLDGGSVGHYVHYEVFSHAGAVQLLVQGIGRVNDARKVFDRVALSNKW